MMATIDWTTLRHAYGGAANIPELLDQARRAPAGGSYRDEPWFSLWSALCHQGDVYTASYAALPELLAIAQARQEDHAAARECVLLAGMIELDRALPEGRSPPPIPSSLTTAYHTALEEGVRLAQSLRARERNQSYARGLDIAAAAMSGNAAEARRLDRLDDEELEDEA